MHLYFLFFFNQIMKQQVEIERLRVRRMFYLSESQTFCCLHLYCIVKSKFIKNHICCGHYTYRRLSRNVPRPDTSEPLAILTEPQSSGCPDSLFSINHLHPRNNNHPSGQNDKLSSDGGTWNSFFFFFCCFVSSLPTINHGCALSLRVTTSL